jgi:DNA-binding NarL/FixJ family response regulator
MPEGLTTNMNQEMAALAELATSSGLAMEEEPAGQDEQAEPAKIRIALVDDHPIVRDGLRKLLELEEDMIIVAEGENGRQALEIIEDLQPEIMLLDLKMPGMDGLTALQTLQHSAHKTRIIVLTASEDKNEWVQAMKLGCCGIVIKQTQPGLIVKSIRKVHSGEIWLDSHTTAAVMRQFASPADQLAASGSKGGRERSPLSNREREIVALVAQGYKNKEMAEKMFISEQTVKNHLHNIFDKLGVSDRLELALYAIHKGLHLGQEAPPR